MRSGFFMRAVVWPHAGSNRSWSLAIGPNLYKALWCLGHIFISIPLLKRYWEPDIHTGMDWMLIILTANMFGNDTHSQICRSACPGLPKQTQVQSASFADCSTKLGCSFKFTFTHEQKIEAYHYTSNQSESGQLSKFSLANTIWCGP